MLEVVVALLGLVELLLREEQAVVVLAAFLAEHQELIQLAVVEVVLEPVDLVEMVVPES
jgi:uncharacterized protein YfaQ (DUF2300 family)